MPTLSSSNKSQLTYKVEGNYPTNWGTAPGGNGVKLNMLSESLNFDVKTVSSKSIRADRQVPDVSVVSANSNGGFAFEMQYKEYDPFVQGVMQQAFIAYGTNGISAAIATLTLASGTVTAGAAPTGNDAFTTLQAGQWFIIEPQAAASQAVKDYFNGRPFRVHTSTPATGTVITLDPSTPINTAIAGTSLTGAQISTSRVGSVLGNGTNFSSSVLLNSYTFEVQHTDIGQYRQYTGMVPSKMMVKLDVGNIVTGSFDFLGKSFNLLQASSMGTPAASQTFTAPNATKGVFDMFENGSSISLLTYIKSGEFTIDNTLRGQEGLGVFGFAGLGIGTQQITGKLELYFAEHTIYQRFINGAASSLSIPLLDVDGNGYVFYFPKIRYTSGKVGVGGLDQDNMLSLDFQAVPDTTAGSATLGQSCVIYRVGV